MKTVLYAVLFLITTIGYAQEAAEAAVKKTVETFFEGFHLQDSTLIKQTVASGMVLQTIGKNKAGENEIRTEDFNQFLTAIVGIPKSTKFEEKLLSFNIQVDGAMANAWTTYEFWVNDTFSHCGVNSFQLFKEDDQWKIIYLIDTRRKKGCGH